MGLPGTSGSGCDRRRDRDPDGRQHGERADALIARRMANGGTDLTKVKYDATTRKLESTAEGVQVDLRALTAIEFDGDTNTVLPYEGGRLDTDVWQIHQQMVTQAQKNRADTIAALAGLAQQIVT